MKPIDVPRPDPSGPVARIRAAADVAEVDRALAAASAEVGAGGERIAREAVVALAESTKELLVTRELLAQERRAREALLASVSHDLRNPLNTFAMSLGLLRDDMERRDIEPTRALGLVGRMDRASERMQHLIEDLLEASRVQAGRIELKKERLSIPELVRESMTNAAGLATEKKLTVSEGTIDEAAFVAADRKKTEEILRKVVAYAIRSCSDRGLVRIDVERTGEEVTVDVTSIIPNHRPQPLKLEEGKGGLSLLIARGLVAAQGGTFSVHTAEGTTFRFTLPAAA